MAAKTKPHLRQVASSLSGAHAWSTPGVAGAAPAGARDDQPFDLSARLELRGVDTPAEMWSPRVQGRPDPASPEAAGVDEDRQVRAASTPVQTTAADSTNVPLPWVARLYVGGVILLGLALAAVSGPLTIPHPMLSAAMLVLVLVTSVLKVSLPVAQTSATMSVSFVADFMALMLLGPQQAMLMAGAGALTQCLVNRPQRKILAYRVVFSVAALIVTVQVTSLVYGWLGGHTGLLEPRDLAKPIVGGSMAYFLCNTILVATASALATRQLPWRVWHDAFLWSAPSYFVGGGVAVAAVWLIGRGEAWFAPMVAAPVYLTYRTYKVYLGRMADGRRHVEEISALHAPALRALALARRSEQALAIEKERLAVTLGTIGEAVIASDTRGRVVLLNHTAEVFTGWSQERAIGSPVIDVLRVVDRENGRSCASPVDKVLRTHAAVEHDHQGALVASDGTTRLVDLSATPIRGDDSAIVAVVLVARDVTDAVRLDEERLKASKLASLGVLAGGIAHDFNNILTAIVGNISLAQMEEGPAAQRHNLARAEKACMRAKALTHQLLTFSKGGAPLKKIIVLREIIREATSFALRGSNVRGEFSLPEGLWAVDADEGQIVQVVNNLVINAVQAMPDGGVLEVRAENVLAGSDRNAAEPSQVRIAIQDQGMGIPEEHLSKIFDPYFTTKQSGSGLGLATCYSIVRNHGGHIDVSSVIGHGTTMFISLPAVADTGRPVAEEAHAALERGKGRVLVMDDEVEIRDLAREMLGRLGYRVDVAADGHEAIELYTEARKAGDGFGTVIMDLTVPGGMGGKDAIKALLAIDPDATAIVSSGYADDPVMSEYQQYGFKGVVPKPFGVADLSRLFQRLVH